MADSEFLRGTQWKAWDGALAVRLDANNAVTGTASILDNLGARIRAVVQAPTVRFI